MSNLNITYRHLFIHVPKTAGTSMEKKNFVGGSGHKTLSMFEKKDLSNIFKWAFVRNPYTRLLSAYYAIQRSPRLKKFLAGKSFKDFVPTELKKQIPSRENFNIEKHSIHLAPQYYFLESNLYQMDFIGRFETIKSDWIYICNKIENFSGKRINKTLETLNKGKYNSNIKTHYTDKIKETVYEIYRRDFEIFKYPEQLP